MNPINLNKINPVLTWPNWLKILCIMGINLSIFLLIYFLIIQPTQQQKQQNDLKIIQLKEEINQLKQFASKKTPSFKPLSLSNLITEINTLAAKNNLSLVAIKPSPPINQQGIKIQSLQIKTIGDYESIRQFLSKLSQSSATITIGDCVLQNSNTMPPLEIILNLHLYTKEL
jgi:Tfp pilus assembly protein PilO